MTDFPKSGIGGVNRLRKFVQHYIRGASDSDSPRRRFARAIAHGAWLVVPLVVSGCAGRSPVISGMLLNFRRADPVLAANDATSRATLQVRWLGTACYLMQLGDKAVFTDPFLTHQSLSRVWLGGAIKSDPQVVSNALAGLPVPRAIFVGHSHYDHLLDAPECLKQPGWRDVPVYGSDSTRNLLHGFCDRFTNAWRAVVADGSWQEVATGIRYQAIPATHGRQLPILPLLYSGRVKKPLPNSPNRASEFKVGESYAFVFELSNEQVTYRIYFIGSAHRDCEGFPDASIESVDTAILCVPTWKLSKGYPDNLIRRLKAQHIVASHYDNFFQVNHRPTEVVALADMEGFLIRAQKSANYAGFEDMVVPSVGSVLRFEKNPSPR
jgi:L-ascorbate metabolism protein UlaG (beta-lactamase superfamily)